jgi:hypothetical protein
MLIKEGLAIAKNLVFESLLDNKVIKNDNNSDSLENDKFVKKINSSVFQSF